MEDDPTEDDGNKTTSPVTDGENTTSSVPPAEEANPGGQVGTWLAHWRSHWDWNDFFYNLLLDLAPAAWDAVTDLLFAKFLETVDVTSAALSYLSICLPALWLVAVRVSKQKTVIKIAAFLMCFSVGLWARVLLKGHLLLFRAPAIFFSGVFLAVKVLAVLVHTPEMAQFSQDMSLAENATEGRLQILLVLHTWLRGGDLHWDTLLSTLLDIGKVGAENFLTTGPKNLLKGKPFFERLLLVLRYLPVFGLTAAFRQCSYAIKVMNYSAGFFLPFNTAFVVSIKWLYFIIEHIVFQLWFAVLRLQMLPSLQQLNIWELANVLLSECTTISVWGGLGRRASRLPQVIMATWFLLHNIIYISLVLSSTSTQEEEVGHTLWQVGKVENFPAFCVTLVIMAVLSYCLAAYQIFAGLEEDNVTAEEAEVEEAEVEEAEVKNAGKYIEMAENQTREENGAGAIGSGEKGAGEATKTDRAWPRENKGGNIGMDPANKSSGETINLEEIEKANTNVSYLTKPQDLAKRESEYPKDDGAQSGQGKNNSGRRQELGSEQAQERDMGNPAFLQEYVEDEQKGDGQKPAKRCGKVTYLDHFHKNSMNIQGGSWKTVKSKKIHPEEPRSTEMDVLSKVRPIGSTWQRVGKSWVRI